MAPYISKFDRKRGRINQIGNYETVGDRGKE